MSDSTDGTAAETTDTEVVRNDEEGRYELVRGDEVLGFTEFEPDAEGRLVFPHTVVDPAYNGQGLGSVLVGAAMADVAKRGETVVPECSFVVRYLQKHEVPGLKVDWPEAA